MRDHDQDRLPLRMKVEELAFDIGRILHANTSTLLMVNHTLEAVSQALAPVSVPGETLASAEAERLHELAQALARRLERLLGAADTERRAAALPLEVWAHLEEQLRHLERASGAASTDAIFGGAAEATI